MDFNLTRIEKSLVEEFRFFARELLRPHAAEADRSGSVPASLSLGRPEVLNYMRSSVPREFAGGWRSLADGKTEYDLFGRAILRVLASEEGGYGDAALFVALPGANLAAPVVQAFASDEMKKAFFSCFAGNFPQWAAFALSEPHAGSDMAAISTTAQKQDHGYVLNGKKSFVGNGARATWTVVMATVNRRLGQFGIRPVMVHQGIPGFTVLRRLCCLGVLGAGQFANWNSANARVPEECFL